MFYRGSLGREDELSNVMRYILVGRSRDLIVDNDFDFSGRIF